MSTNVSIEHLRQLLADDHIEQAIADANTLIASVDADASLRAEAYYLRGNAYRRLNDLRMAQNSYLESAELDPEGPGAQAFGVLQEILEFYNKDYYNP